MQLSMVVCPVSYEHTFMEWFEHCTMLAHCFCLVIFWRQMNVEIHYFSVFYCSILLFDSFIHIHNIFWYTFPSLISYPSHHILTSLSQVYNLWFCFVTHLVLLESSETPWPETPLEPGWYGHQWVQTENHEFSLFESIVIK